MWKHVWIWQESCISPGLWHWVYVGKVMNAMADLFTTQLRHYWVVQTTDTEEAPSAPLASTPTRA